MGGCLADERRRDAFSPPPRSTPAPPFTAESGLIEATERLDRGTRNEHRSRQLLEAAGYAVTRAAGSLGAWNLIGVGSTDVVLCQVKTRDWPGLVEMETLRDFAVPPNCRRLVHRWRDRQRVPDVREL